MGASVIDVDSASSLTLGASATAGNDQNLIINGTVGSSFSLGATTFAEGKNIVSNSNFTIASLTGLVKITSETLTFRGLGTGSVTGAISPNQTLNPAGAAIFLTVNKDDGGTWNFNGANTYNGTTAVNNGLLRINGSTLAANAVTVANAAGLGGTGTINGAVTLNSTSRIDLGNGAVGTLTLAAAGTALNIAGAANANNLVFDLAAGGTTTDKIVVTTGANMGTSGAGVVVPNQLGGAGNRLTAGTYDIMTAPGGTALTAGGGTSGSRPRRPSARPSRWPVPPPRPSS